MISIVMGAGILLIALGVSAELSLRQPMAIVVIGALVVSTLLSVFVLPALFDHVDDVQPRGARQRSRKPSGLLVEGG